MYFMLQSEVLAKDGATELLASYNVSVAGHDDLRLPDVYDVPRQGLVPTPPQRQTSSNGAEMHMTPLQLFESQRAAQQAQQAQGQTQPIIGMYLTIPSAAMMPAPGPRLHSVMKKPKSAPPQYTEQPPPSIRYSASSARPLSYWSDDPSPAGTSK